jgi:serine/threonine-protein kinase
MRLLKEGQQIRETYEVERYLGEGAFAEVYRVKHRFLGRQAMKVFKTPGLTLPEIEAGLEEAVLLSRIGHPNIVRVYDANIIESQHGSLGFFTMEYIAGGSLERFWQSHGRGFVPVQTAVDIARQACRGLAVAHGDDPPIIHRDLKPQNILVGYDAAGLRIRLSDFGLAKKVNPLTLLASAKGTLLFKSPEAISDLSQDSSAGDVWALGATLYLLLTDRLPYAAPREEGWLRMDRFSHLLVPASQLNFEVNPQLDSILARALAVEAAERYWDAAGFLHDLDGWQPGRREVPRRAARAAGIDESKNALGVHETVDETSAKDKAEKAVRLSRQASKLTDAADLLEEAITEWPPLRVEYEYRLSLWRRGLMM